MNLTITTIKEIASEAVFNAKVEANMDINNITIDNVRNEIETQFVIRNFEFENERTKSLMESLVMGEVKSVCIKTYETIYPPCYMDKNGNYTHDSTKWV